MTKQYYVTKFTWCAIFLALIYAFVAYPDYDSHIFNLYFPLYAIFSSAFYPFAFKLAEWISPRLTESTAWRHSGGLFCMLLAIPFGIIYLLVKLINKQ